MVKFRVIPKRLSNLEKFRLRRAGLPVKADIFTVVATHGYWKVKEAHVYSTQVEAAKARLAVRVTKLAENKS